MKTLKKEDIPKLGKKNQSTKKKNQSNKCEWKNRKSRI